MRAGSRAHRTPGRVTPVRHALQMRDGGEGSQRAPDRRSLRSECARRSNRFARRANRFRMGRNEGAVGETPDRRRHDLCVQRAGRFDAVFRSVDRCEQHRNVRAAHCSNHLGL